MMHRTQKNIKSFPIRLITFMSIFFLLTSSAIAQNPENIEARKFAAEFFSTRNPKTLGKKSAISPDLIQSYQSIEKVKNPLYVFQQGEKGFAMIAQSNDNYTIVAYSDDALFHPVEIPPQMRALMDYYEDSLQFPDPLPGLQQTGTPIVSPLLNLYGISLNQYMHSEVDGCPTGCVATAVTQIMLYHAARLGTPVKGYGSYCYTDDKHGQLCADFSDTYSSNELLSFDVGKSMEMQYCGDPYGSVAKIDFAEGLENHFHYYTGVADAEDYFVKNELDHQRPLYIGLWGEPTGHAFVLDGYDSNGYYHLNFGWEGYCNGYYLLNKSDWISPSGVFKFITNIKGPRIISPTPIPVNSQDSLALIAINQAMGGTSVTGWDLSKPVFSWPGVLLMNERVIKLSINSNIPAATSQSIATEIGNLTALRELSINGCFNGNIPSSISQLTELRVLTIVNKEVYIEPNLHIGNLKGQLPANIGNLTKLEWLSISNALDGTIPASIGNLTNLKLLWIDQNPGYFGQGNLTGSIPAAIGNLNKLSQLHISNQKLTGSIPATLNNLSELRELDLSGNLLGGAVPALNLPKLGYLNLNNNKFTGFADGIGNCPELVDLQLQNNQIQGDLPSYFANFTNLKSFNLSDNQLESLPDEIGNLFQLERIILDNNEFQSLPAGLAIINNLKYISARNNIIAVLPDNLAQSRRLLSLDLSNNLIENIPEEIGNCQNITEVFLNSNRIKSIPLSFGNIYDGATILLQDNEIQGPVPENLLMAYEYSRQVRLDSNRLVFNDIPMSENLNIGLRHQKNVQLKKQVFKVREGDTITIDIRSISNLSHPGNEYYWLTYPELSNVIIKDERFSGVENNPVFQIIINKNNINNKYYCKVFNPDVPSYSFDYNGSTVTTPCLEYLNTDTVVFEMGTEEEIIAGEFPDDFVTSLHAITNKTISDGIVTLLAPENIKRGVVKWEASTDGINWVSVSGSMEQSDLKLNIKTISNNKLVLNPRNTAYYRCSIHEDNCDPFYSEKLKVNPLGTILFDEIINVTEETRTISIDSIEIVVPKNFHESDFRLTITKLENPPAAPANMIPGSAFDVSVSFSETFELPLLIKLKNIDKSKITSLDIDKFKAVYFDDMQREWKQFDHAHLSLKDSSLVISTDHLTKLSWWWDEEAVLGYTDFYERNNIRVFYKEGDLDFMKFGYAKKQSPQDWHIAGTPLLVQDITEYLSKVMTRYKFLGLEVPDGRFSVYVKQMDDAGCVGLLGMLNGYMMIDANMSSTVELRQVLAHEYMHYTQDYYISANPGNSFWMEAHATLADRIVWNETEVPLCESEELMISGRTSKISIFNFLSNSWDYWDKSLATNNMLGNIHYNYLAGTFLHYMRTEREAAKLEPATLLKETSWFGSWRTYLASYTNNHLDALLGDEYEDYVKYILTGKKENFTVINKKGNPYSYLQDPKNKGVFTHPVSYRFREGDEMVQKDEIEIKVPYLAAKIVLFENTNPDTMVLVNYKRKHNFDYDHKVYYGSYDFQNKEMSFIDISDSLEYNFLLDVCNEDNVLKKFGNYSFLLLINKEYIGAGILIDDFNASFEITAMPVLNIESIGLLDIYNNNTPMTHNFSDGTDYISIGSPNASFLQYATGFDVRMVNKTTTKRIVDDQTYQIQTQFTLVIDQGFIKGIPTMKDSTIYTQTIDHDIISGVLRVTEHAEKIHKLHTYIRYVTNTELEMEEVLEHPEYVDSKEIKTKTYWLNDFMNIMRPPEASLGWEESYGENIILFETGSTTETTNVVSKIDASIQLLNYNLGGGLTSETNRTYTNTDFSTSGLKLRMIIRTENHEQRP